MKKNIIKLLSLFVLIGFSSCQDDDNDYPTAEAKPVVSLSQASYTGAEGQPVTITLNLDKAINKPIDLKLELVDDSKFDDLTFTGAALLDISTGWGDLPAYSVVIPANTSTYSFTTTLIDDEVYSPNKVYTFKLSTAGNLNGTFASGSEVFFDVTFSNTVSDVLNLTFAWDQTFDFGGETYTLCDLAYDVDVVVLDENFADMDITDAQTGDCPEHLSMSLADYPDGTYYLAGYLYDNAGIAGVGIPEFDIPMTISYQRGGSQGLSTEGSFSADFLESESPNDEFILVAIVIIENGVFTIQNADEVTIAQGRQANLKKALKTFKSKRAATKKVNFLKK